MSTRFAIVTDSTADLPGALAAEQQIYTVPMHIIWDDQDLRDGIDIDSKAFYERLASSPTVPTTSQPSLDEFHAVYDRARQETGAAEIIVLTISSKLSGAYNAAVQSARAVDFPVHVVDTFTGSMAHALTALALAQERDNGISAEAAVALAQKIAAKTKMIFALDTLEYLYRSGRISNLRRWLGTALQIKPILHVKDGSIAVLDQVRTRKRMLNCLTTLFEEMVDKSKPLWVGVLHGNAIEDMQNLLDEIRSRWDPALLIENTVCAPVGAHTGPGSIGFALLQW